MTSQNTEDAQQQEAQETAEAQFLPKELEDRMYQVFQDLSAQGGAFADITSCFMVVLHGARNGDLPYLSRLLGDYVTGISVRQSMGAMFEVASREEGHLAEKPDATDSQTS